MTCVAKRWLSALCVLCAAAGARADSKVVQETWDAAFLNGAQAGYVRTAVREATQGGEKVLLTTVELNLRVKRFRDQISLQMTTGTSETADGKVRKVAMRQVLGKDQDLVMVGTVQGDQLHVKVNGGQRLDKKIPWNDQVVGLHRQERLYQERRVKPGDEFTYQSFEPQVTAVITTNVSVKDYETVTDLVTGGKKSLLRAEAVAEKIGNFQLPPMVVWLNKDRVPVRSRFEVPGLGTLVLQRTKREFALRQDAGVAQVDIGISQLVPLDHTIRDPYEAKSAVYRITVKGDTDPATTFAQDGRQRISDLNGNTFELQVEASRAPRDLRGAYRPAKKEYLESCYFINSDDKEVRRHARQAVGDEIDPWEKALRIEEYVHKHMTNKNFTEAFATADHVARTLEGDCTEHAVLAAAMCRAAGVPSRAAVGLLYVDSGNRPVMGFHMWTEVFVRGQWMPIDATLGRGYVGATHLKIADHSWHDTQSLTPLLPVLRVLGKLKIEVVSVDY